MSDDVGITNRQELRHGLHSVAEQSRAHTTWRLAIVRRTGPDQNAWKDGTTTAAERRDASLQKRILCITVECDLTRSLRQSLVAAGYEVERVADPQAGKLRSFIWRPHAIILDITLGGVEALEVCRDLAEKMFVPIVLLAVRAGGADAVEGFRPDADDESSTPFSIDEVTALVRVVLRQPDAEARGTPIVRFADVVIDIERVRVERGGVPVPFTQKELELLIFLTAHPKRVFTRDELLQMVWGYHEAPLTRTVDTHVARLRQRLEADPHNPRYIQTAYGTGYVFKP